MRTSLFLALALATTSAQADSLSNALIENLAAMKSVYRAEYAPAGWKKTYANYDLDVAYQQAVNAANANPALSQAQSRAILKNFIYAMKDYHTSISFVATEAASLPLTVKGAEDRFFIAYIDRSKLSESAFPFQVGDEVVSFDGKPALQAVTEVQAEKIENVADTDRARAELVLTHRAAAAGINVPQGPVTLGIKRNGSNTVSTIQLIWDYTPEEIQPRTRTMVKTTSRRLNNPSLISKPMMDIAIDVKLEVGNPYDMGARKTFTPDLGTKLWQSSDSDTFYAYLYQNQKKQLIGYVRIPSYAPQDYNKAVDDFKEIIKRFESTTDALIIDQANNPGGAVYYLYALASMLTDQPLKTPLHHMSITQADVLNARNQIQALQFIKTDEDAKSTLSDLNGYPASYELVQFILGHARMVIAEWEAGHHLTRPFWINGIDHVNPAPIHYTHPILLLTNHLDFSGGDFFPAIMQDNKRVTILGSRTAGAGGYVYNYTIPNNIGIDAFRVTESIAERLGNNPIENLGVTPDITYEMTPSDYQSNFQPYVNKIKETVDAMIQG